MEERTCPSGHKLPVDQFHSYLDLTKTNIDDAILFDCPGGKRGHTFTLVKAAAAGMFTPDEAAKIRSSAYQHKAEWSVR